ncbi:MAG: hypothetical protein U5K74_04535 [Gemmatimonadaceae bacterium]|nr:hypothetical protein [Gemmatimonadaceae bacterium]
MTRTRTPVIPRPTAARGPGYDEQVRQADALRRRGRYVEAQRAFHAIAMAHPERSDAFSNLAAILQATGNPMPALQAVSRAIELDPTNVSALLNSAEILKDFGEWATVAETYDAARALRPTDPAIRFARALHLLLLGRWSDGWVEHEQRQLVPDLPLRRSALTSPAWDGTPLDGRDILLDHEQGLGDQIMFSRFASQVAARGGRVTIRCSAPLAELFASLAGVTAVSVEGSPVPPHDVHASLMSLPALLGVTSPDAIEGAPYLRATGDCPAPLAAMLPLARGPRVGLVWSGNPQHRNDARRSLAPAQLTPLLALHGVQFVALQRHETGVLLPEGLQNRVIDAGAALHSLNDTAHALRRLDLLITVDTAVAHLAGALGVRTLLLLPFVPDWRWMVDRADTPWYRSVRLLRQATVFEWQPVIDAARHEILALTGHQA